MKIVTSNLNENMELPLQLTISFQKVFSLFKKYASEEFSNHPYHKSSLEIVEDFKNYPEELIEGFSDFSLLEKYQDQIDLLLDPLFPELLLLNEIKAASIPFSFTSFKFTTRFEQILNNAGEHYKLSLRNFEEDTMYIMACTFIMNLYYGFSIDLKRPFFFDIPDKNSGITKHYRTAFNGDFSEIIPTKNAPKITEEDYRELLDNFENIKIWKEKFPPGSYIFKGFGIMNLFDVTADEIISSIRTNLLRSSDNLNEELQHDLREFFEIKDLMLGFSIFTIENGLNQLRVKMSESTLFTFMSEISCSNHFCHHIVGKIFNQYESVAISDVEMYGQKHGHNPFYHQLHKVGIGSIILIPVKASNNKDLTIIEIASPRPFELNSINQNKLKDIISAFEIAVERFIEEQQNVIEATIQEHYTTIHSSVKWRFIEAAEKYQRELQEKNQDIKPDPDEIIFENVFPLYGQSDIKGSSLARNNAIKEDLATQLMLTINVLSEAYKKEKLPIYEELTFRVSEYLNEVNSGLKAGDEISILNFLKRDIYPVFKHAKRNHKPLRKEVDKYMERLDDNLHVIYEKRKNYEN